MPAPVGIELVMVVGGGCHNSTNAQAIKVRGIPACYLLKKGKVADQRIGWPGEGKANLLTLIAAGTLDPALP